MRDSAESSAGGVTRWLPRHHAELLRCDIVSYCASCRLPLPMPRRFTLAMPIFGGGEQARCLCQPRFMAVCAPLRVLMQHAARRESESAPR